MCNKCLSACQAFLFSLHPQATTPFWQNGLPITCTVWADLQVPLLRHSPLSPSKKKKREKKKAVLFGALKMIRYTELLIFRANDCTHTTFKDILGIFHHFIRALDHFMLKLGSKLSVCQGLGFPQSAGAGWHMSSPSFQCNFNVAVTEEIRW